MKLKYDTLTIEVDYDVISIEDVLIEETLNDHGMMQITFLVSEDKAKEQVMREGANQVIRVTEGETSLFVGRLSGITMSCRKSQTILETSWESFTAKYDEERKKRAITAADYTAADIIKEVIKPYKGLFQNAFPKGEPLSQFLLQYGETDWEFLKRLAGKEGTILTPVNTSEAGVFWYGLPDGER